MTPKFLVLPDIREWLSTHRIAKVGAKNVEALSGFLANPAHKGLTTPPTSSKNARREGRKGLRSLAADELASFLEQGQRADHHKALLKDVLRT